MRDGHSVGEQTTEPQVHVLSPWTTHIDYPKINYAAEIKTVIRVRGESGPILGHYTGKTDLKIDSPIFPSLITKHQRHSSF